MLTSMLGPNAPATTGKHALCKGAGEENGKARYPGSRGQEARAAEVAY